MSDEENNQDEDKKKSSGRNGWDILDAIIVNPSPLVAFVMLEIMIHLDLMLFLKTHNKGLLDDFRNKFPFWYHDNFWFCLFKNLVPFLGAFVYPIFITYARRFLVRASYRLTNIGLHKNEDDCEAADVRKKSEITYALYHLRQNDINGIIDTYMKYRAKHNKFLYIFYENSKFKQVLKLIEQFSTYINIEKCGYNNYVLNHSNGRVIQNINLDDYKNYIDQIISSFDNVKIITYDAISYHHRFCDLKKATLENIQNNLATLMNEREWEILNEEESKEKVDDEIPF
jgi:hypothetical protein